MAGPDPHCCMPPGGGGLSEGLKDGQILGLDRCLPAAAPFTDLTSIIAPLGPSADHLLYRGDILGVCTVKESDKSFISLKQPQNKIRFLKLACIRSHRQGKRTHIFINLLNTMHQRMQ